METALWCFDYGFWIDLLDGYHPSQFQKVKDCQHHYGRTECKGCSKALPKQQTAHYREHFYILNKEEGTI